MKIQLNVNKNEIFLQFTLHTIYSIISNVNVENFAVWPPNKRFKYLAMLKI